MRVSDVNEFPGHIACDSSTESELVIPLIKNGIVYGVLDLDSPLKRNFTEIDEIQLTSIMNVVSDKIF